MAGGADFFRKSVASFVPDTVKTTLFTDALGYDGWAALGALEDTMQAVMWFKVLSVERHSTKDQLSIIIMLISYKYFQLIPTPWSTRTHLATHFFAAP